MIYKCGKCKILFKSTSGMEENYFIESFTKKGNAKMRALCPNCLSTFKST